MEIFKLKIVLPIILVVVLTCGCGGQVDLSSDQNRSNPNPDPQGSPAIAVLEKNDVPESKLFVELISLLEANSKIDIDTIISKVGNEFGEPTYDSLDKLAVSVRAISIGTSADGSGSEVPDYVNADRLTFWKRKNAKATAHGIEIVGVIQKDQICKAFVGQLMSP